MMDEYTMSAFALYSDGRTGEAFAEVSEVSLVACFAKMAGEVADWLPGALAHGGGSEPPRAIELTLEWSGAPAPAPAPELPAAPSDSAREAPQPPITSMRCTARRRLCSVDGVGFAIPAALRGAPA